MNSKKINWRLMGVVAAIGVVVSGCTLFGKGDNAKTITMNQLPGAVKTAAEKEIADSKIIEVERELKDSMTIYAITYNDNGREMEVEYSPDGTLLSKGPE